MSKQKYIFYKVIFIISTILLSGFILYEIGVFICALTWDYPYPALGIDINNPFEAWWTETVFNLIFAGVPLILDIAALIISRRKIKSFKNSIQKESGEN